MRRNYFVLLNNLLFTCSLARDADVAWLTTGIKFNFEKLLCDVIKVIKVPTPTKFIDRWNVENFYKLQLFYRTTVVADSN